MVIGKGNDNHHDQSYTIQITTTGRRITCNRQCIRQTSITTDYYICYQAKKHANRQTDPLDAILEHIKNNLMLYSKRTVQSNINNTQSTHDEEPKKHLQESRQIYIQRTVTNTMEDNNKIQQGENCIKTRYGRTIRKADGLSYK